MTILRTLLEITVYSAVLLVAVLLFRTVAKKHASPAMRYAAWFLLIARLLIPVTIGGISLIVLPAQEAAVQTQQVDLPALNNEPTGDSAASPNLPAAVDNEPASAEIPVVQVDAQAGNAAVVNSPRAELQWSWETALIALWILGAVAVRLNNAIAAAKLNERLAAALPLPEDWQQTALRIQKELHIRGRVRYVMMKDFTSPALNMSFRPTVVIPMELRWYDEAYIDFALRHELTHVKRGDHLVCLLLTLLKAVYWFNPVVWFAARLMKADMETACDSRVVAPMDGPQKKQYASTIIGMYAQAQPRFVLGLALGHTRHTAERRVRGIYMRGRSARGTKAAAVLMALVMLFACFTTACQPVSGTVSEPPLTSEPSPSPTETPATPEPSPTQMIDKVSHWQDTLTYDDLGLTCNIDAQIVWPETNIFPVYKVKQREFDAETVTKIVQYFTQGAMGVRVTSDTREELEMMIEGIKELDFYSGREEELADLNDRLAKVTDEVFSPVSGDILTLPVENTYAMPDGSRVFVHASPAIFFINTYKYGGTQPESWLVDDDSLPKPLRGITFDDISISEQDAIAAVNVAVADLGLENVGIAKTEKAAFIDLYTLDIYSKGWEITLARKDGNSIPLWLDSERSGLLDFMPSREDYAPKWFPERMTFYIDENGIQQFSWDDMLEVTEVLEPDVTIMPFKDMRACIGSAIEAGFTKRLESGAVGTAEHEIAVEKVVLSNVLVPIKGDLEHQLLTPAWVVFYYNTVFDRFGKHVCVFAVDAVTGSPIDISNTVYMDLEDDRFQNS